MMQGPTMSKLIVWVIVAVAIVAAAIWLAGRDASVPLQRIETPVQVGGVAR